MHVLKGINLDIERGEFVSIMGASGSGKSTLLNILGILDNYDEGLYTLNGVTVKNLSETKAADYRNRLIGFIFQSFNLIGYKTALENVALPLYYQGVARKERNRRAMEHLERLGLDKWADHYPNELSGGQKRRVAIAGVLAMKPEILILDEPTAGLDPRGRDEILDQIAKLHKEGLTVILVSHSMEDVAKYADRIIAMNDGKVAFDGTPKEVFRHYRELERMGLSAPQITYVMQEMKGLGLDVDIDVSTVEEAKEEILRAFKKSTR